MSKPKDTGGGAATFEEIEVRKADPNTFEKTEDANAAFTALEETLDRAVEAGKTVEAAQSEIHREIDSLKDGVASLARPKAEGTELSRKARAMIDRTNFENRRLPGENADLTFAERVAMIPASDAREDAQIDDVRRLNDTMCYVRFWAQMNGVDPRSTKTWSRYSGALEKLERGYGGDDASGNYLLPSLMSTELDELVEQKPGIAQLFRQVQMTSKTLDISRMSSRGKAFAAPDNSADISVAVKRANDQFAKQTLTAHTLVAAAFIDKEWSEDQMLREVGELLDSQATAIVNAQNDMILNGDAGAHTAHQDYVAGSSSDYAVTDALDARCLVDGIRRLCIAGADAATRTSIAVLYLDDIVSSMTAQGIYGVYPPNRKVWMGPINVWKHLVNLKSEDTGGSLVHATWDTYGPGAFNRSGTLGDRGSLPGQVGTFLGSPFIASEQLSGTLNASGVYDESTTDNTQLLSVVPEEFYFASRVGIRQYYSTEQGLVMLKDYIQSERRCTFAPVRGALGATYAPAHLFYNITV